MSWHPDMPDEFKNQIVTGDARILAERIPDESIDLVFTDPVYGRIDDYRWLAETAARVLKPDSPVLIWCGIGYLPETLQALIQGGLTYKWELCALRPLGVKSRYCMKNVFGNWRALLWFEKGKSWPITTISDVGYSNDGSNNVHLNGKWDKSFKVTVNWLAKFASLDAAILDPFCGGATIPAACKWLGIQHWLGFEIDPIAASQGRGRLSKTPPPLISLEPEQVSFGLAWNN